MLAFKDITQASMQNTWKRKHVSTSNTWPHKGANTPARNFADLLENKKHYLKGTWWEQNDRALGTNIKNNCTNVFLINPQNDIEFRTKQTRNTEHRITKNKFLKE